MTSFERCRTAVAFVLSTLLKMREKIDKLAQKIKEIKLNIKILENRYEDVAIEFIKMYGQDGTYKKDGIQIELS